nr:MAG TPA: Putative tail protein [Bacteriophage sp.]
MIQIKRNNKVFFTLEDFGEGSKLSYQLMDHHYIILKFTTATPVYFEIGDSVEIPDFGYFELTSAYFPKHNDSDGYDYEMQMDAYYMSWKNKLCKYRPQRGANETSFKLTTTVGVHMNVILGNLKALGLTYNGKEFSVDYTTYNNKAFDVQKRFLIEYGSISILDALNSICSEDALNCEWWIDGSIIYLGYCEMEGQTTFEQDVNVLSMSYSESKSTYITRLYAFGSDRNIPKGYFTGADADVTTDGVATDYLMLPNKEVDSDGFYSKDGYLENVNVVKNDKQAIEGVVMFEDEYPKVESVVSGIKTYDSTVDNDDGTKTTQTFWQVTATDSFATGFEASWIKSNLTLGIKFTSGALMGMEFDVSFKVIDKVNYFEIVANDTYGRTLPDGVMCPKIGDKFFLYNWDATKIADTNLIPAAQLSLFDRAKQYYQKTMISNSNFTCTMDGDKFYNDGTYDYHPLGEQVKLINDMFAQVDADGKHYRNSRIIGMEIPLDIPYDHPQYTVGEKAATSRLGKLEDKVDSITVNGMQIGGTGSGNGGVYVIGLNDSTPASDSNVFSARRSRMEFLSRLQDNTAKSTITWEKIQKLVSGLLVGNFNNENGGSWTPDAEGRSHLVTDYLEVRMKAIFEELVIKKTSTIGGKEIISPAGGVVAHKVEEVTVTYNNVSQKAYRCYFLAEQEGDSVDNDFAIGDQVRSESFNVRKGTYHKVGNHFYWRLVIGRDEEPVELEGKKYHYIDLSDTDCATASDVPAKGDVLNQCGNRTDVDRQNCLIFSAVDTYSPSVSLYHGINSYSFANKEYVEYGVNKQTNKAFFNVYGDMYVGDRPTKENGYEGSSYIKYDSAAKQVSVKGKISAKSTVDGKELSQYIKENSAKGLTEEQVNNLIKNSQVIVDLQNQVDGAIETWFYEGVPTLKNAPASSWTTDKEKDTHLGDLYYDNKTGKAYRFAKDGSTYKWTVITDTDIAKALSDASKAQETADGKMKVFSTQPIPPYQLGDIWVNATYPTDGSTYKNEILRCQTAKTKGSSFAIADWTKASKYTDDSALNTFKEEYKNDMASYKEQLDEKVETWFYNYAPTTQNKPASDWTTDTLKSQHAGDLFYNTSNGYTYRWTGTAWARIKDNDINTAMTAASKAQDTADGKRTVFTSQPTVPYDEGDLWASGGDDGKTLMVCVKSRVTGSFTSSEWVKANDSDLNAFAKTIEESLKGIRDQLDKKAETWYQATDPSTSWTTDDAKKEHKGDLWYNTSNNQTFFWNGTKWDKQDVPTEVFDKIDGKSSIYVSKPASYEERDLWILEAAYTLGGVAYSKGELVVATKSNASFSAADWTKKVKYTDDTVANAAKKAAEEAKKAADTAQTNVTNLGKTVTSNKKAFDNYVTDGYLEPSEIAAMAQDSKRLEDAFAAAEKSYTEVKEAAVLKDTKELTDLNTAFVTLSTAKTELIKYLSDISARYNAANTEGKATIVSAVGTKFTNFQSAYSAFYDKLGLANAYITSKIYGDLKQNITDLAGYKYIKDALGQTTDIDGGLVMTTLLALRDADGNVQSGINGAIDQNRGKKSIATWWGGRMVDKDYNSGSLTPATSLIRFDGSGYLANGAIWWDVDGKVHADPTSFIISEKNLGAYLTFFEPTWKEGSAGTSVADLVSLKPNAPFSKLGVSGDATFEGAITFHGIKLTYDATNKAIKVDGNLYATGGITAYGAGASTTGGGGGLNASVISYARIIEGNYTDADLTSIPNAYAIKALSSRIDNIATELGGLNLSWNNITGKPSTYTPSAHTHKWADITDRITKVSQLTNDSGYTKNTGTVTSVSLTLPAGLTCATKTITTSGTFAISLASGYSIPTTAKQTAWDSAYDWYVLMTTDEETADGIINKWNEVVSFLANIAQTDTLSGIVDGINKSISDEVTRAKKAEGVNASGISANKTSITTLQGYFTSGSAKKALQLTNARKLWGNSFNGTADINGSIIVPSGKYISIGNIKMEYDATNKALKITNTTTDEVANLYTSGGVSAYGVGTSSSSGGGLNGSVKSYSDALKLTSESLSEVASAYSIKALDSRISSLEGGSATAISVSGSGNAVTSITKNGTTINVVKGSTFLTSHQSLANYYTKSATDGLLAGKADRASAMTFKNDNNSLYVNASFESAELSKIASDKYIECWDGAGGWWNWKSGKYIVAGGTSSQFLKADGSLDSNTYSRIGEVLKSIDFTSENSSFDANNLRKAITFAYKTSKHINTATTGTIVDFCCTNEKYSFQLQSSYMSDGLYYRRNNGDNGIWGDWVRLATINDIPKSLPASDVYAWAKASTKPSYSWSEIGSRPTKVSQFTNDSGYITSSASITGNAATATKLQTARTIWGQSFDGTGDINGLFVSGGIHIGYGNEIWCTDNLVINYNNRKSKNVYILNGNLGIGNMSASEKLDVNGSILSREFIKIQAHSGYGSGAARIWFDGNTNAVEVMNNFRVTGGITGVNNITMSNNSYLYGKNTGGTAIQLIAMASWNSVDIGRGALVNGYTTQVMGKTVAITASNDSGKNVKSVELSTAKLYSNVNIETEGGLLAHGGVTAYQTSDERLKHDIHTINCLDIVREMGGTVAFRYNADNSSCIGWIAQRVLQNPHLKDIVETDENGYYKINYWSPKLIATAFGAIEQVGDEVSRLKARVVFLESEVQRLSGDKEDCNKKRLDNKNNKSLN